ncbi:hypothetical protein OG462_44870 [Streptomyces sp. NBC_01077]|uniref:hypothetical protein n=1 Tax=Streptomyces sp. NBC_01077 TaxID=2903746 RepID=UPI00386F4AA1|nr:hypothetical protein OG462_00130 [Streptomyces sp. NBC_01077]WSV43808.1 hypothetical protein OG462_44870 [Streptomyces sp. NBC_01077]
MAQRERLEVVGVIPHGPGARSVREAVHKASGGLRAGSSGLAQYKARTGSVIVSRAHTEQLEDGTEVKLGVFLSKSRRAKLTPDKLGALAALGLAWAAAG